MGAVSTSTVIRSGPFPAFNELPGLLSARQVADALSCTTQHVRILREAGDIVAIDIRAPGARTATYRFYKDSLRIYLATRPRTTDLI